MFNKNSRSLAGIENNDSHYFSFPVCVCVFGCIFNFFGKSSLILHRVQGLAIINLIIYNKHSTNFTPFSYLPVKTFPSSETEWSDLEVHKVHSNKRQILLCLCFVSSLLFCQQHVFVYIFFHYCLRVCVCVWVVCFYCKKNWNYCSTKFVWHAHCYISAFACVRFHLC